MVAQSKDLLTAEQSEALMPLQNVSLDIKVDGGFAAYELDLTYFNPLNSLLEAHYVFPLEKNTVLTNLTAKIGEKVIEAKVQTK